MHRLYHGHDGVRGWFAQVERCRYQHRIVLSDVGDGQAVAAGSLSLAREPELGQFCALHRLDGGPIVSARPYHTDPDMIERLGLIP